MPNLSGTLYYATGRFDNMSGLVGLSNIPIVVQDTTTNVGIVVATDASGNYTVNSIPAGDYRIVEAYGATGSVISPADFTQATTLPIPTPQDPPLSAITVVTIAGTNQVDSLSANTLFIPIAGNVSGLLFIDSSISNIPLTLPTGVILGNNILTKAGNGIWGTLPAGTYSNTNPGTYPYSDSMVSSLLTYTNDNLNLSPLNSNHFTMTNINSKRWFLAPNHTTFDETSSYMLVNAGDPDALLFEETITIPQNSFYFANAWLLMLTNFPNTCKIGFKVLAQDGLTQLFYGETTNIQYGQWIQMGQIFNTQNNSQVTVQLLSMSNIVDGNDFALDDLTLQSVSLSNFVTLTKSVDKSTAKLGDTLTYTSVLTASNTLANVVFQDTLPTGSSFNAGTVLINGTVYPSYDPQAGFTIPSIPLGSLTTITFSVDIVSIPPGNVLNNMSKSTYSTELIPGNTIITDIFSNTVPTFMEYANLQPSKSANKFYATLGDTIIYTITLVNSGNITATNNLFLDSIPNGTTLINGSVIVNGVTLPSADPSLGGIPIGTIPANANATITFNVLVTTLPILNPIPNSGVLHYSYTPSGSSIVNINTITNTVTTTISSALLSSSKTVDKSYTDIGNILTYTIPIINIGNTTATTIIFIDTIPTGTTLVANSFYQDAVLVAGSPNPPGSTLPSSINPGATSTVTFQVLITTLPSPNPIPNSATQTYSYVVDPTTTPNLIGNRITSTNIVYTQINHANLGRITKFTNKIYAKCQETITYTLVIPNTGNTTATNVFFQDSIPAGTLFVTDSLAINGNPTLGIDPTLGFTLPDINPGTTSTITFQVQIEC